MVSASDAVLGWVLFFLKRRLKGDFWDCCPSFSMSSFVNLVMMNPNHRFSRLQANALLCCSNEDESKVGIHVGRSQRADGQAARCPEQLTVKQRVHRATLDHNKRFTERQPSLQAPLKTQVRNGLTS